MKPNNIILILLGTALILAVPLLAMMFTDSVRWDWFDFAVMGTLLLGAGLTYELISKKLGDTTHRAVFGIAIVAAVLLIWAELAVGLFGSPIAGS